MLRHAIEVIDFLAEEPSEFGLSCIGSRGMAGVLDDKMLRYTDPSGEVLSHAIDRVGGNVAALTSAKRSDIAAFFELHIEQGLVLQDGRIDVGIVTAIVGITRIEVVFKGSADHAGTTPMHLRRDAFTPAAKTAVFVDRIAREFVARKAGLFVATIGIVSVTPGASNVVPQEARIVIDARSENRALMDEFLALLDRETTAFAEESRTERAVLRAAVRHQSDRLRPGACANCCGTARKRLASPAPTLRPARDTTPPLSRGSRRRPCCSSPAATEKVTRRKNGRSRMRWPPAPR